MWAKLYIDGDVYTVIVDTQSFDLPDDAGDESLSSWTIYQNGPPSHGTPWDGPSKPRSFDTPLAALVDGITYLTDAIESGMDLEWREKHLEDVCMSCGDQCAPGDLHKVAGGRWFCPSCYQDYQS